MLLQLPGDITKITSRSNQAVRIQFDSHEGMSLDVLAQVMRSFEKYGWFCFLEDKQISEEEVLKLPDIPADPKMKRSKSQILRWRIEEWGKARGHKGADLEAFYSKQMDMIISAVDQKNS